MMECQLADARRRPPVVMLQITFAQIGPGVDRHDPHFPHVAPYRGVIQPSQKKRNKKPTPVPCVSFARTKVKD